MRKSIVYFLILIAISFLIMQCNGVQSKKIPGSRLDAETIMSKSHMHDSSDSIVLLINFMIVSPSTREAYFSGGNGTIFFEARNSKILRLCISDDFFTREAQLRDSELVTYWLVQENAPIATNAKIDSFDEALEVAFDSTRCPFGIWRAGNFQPNGKIESVFEDITLPNGIDCWVIKVFDEKTTTSYRYFVGKSDYRVYKVEIINHNLVKSEGYQGSDIVQTADYIYILASARQLH
jgi:hypothetical protein